MNIQEKCDFCEGKKATKNLKDDYNLIIKPDIIGDEKAEDQTAYICDECFNRFEKNTSLKTLKRFLVTHNPEVKKLLKRFNSKKS